MYKYSSQLKTSVEDLIVAKSEGKAKTTLNYVL